MFSEVLNALNQRNEDDQFCGEKLNLRRGTRITGYRKDINVMERLMRFEQV